MYMYTNSAQQVINVHCGSPSSEMSTWEYSKYIMQHLGKRLVAGYVRIQFRTVELITA